MRAGFSKNIVDTYLSYMNNLIIHNQYARGLGRARSRYTSLPQGCPFSMRFLALMMEPWHQQIKLYEAVPRSLADDLLHYARGPNSTHISARAYLFTNEYIIHVGSKATISKTFAFGSHQISRNAHNKLWFAQQPNDEIKVPNETRDIGGHLDLIGNQTNTTVSKRMNSTTKNKISLNHCIASTCKVHCRYQQIFAEGVVRLLYCANESKMHAELHIGHSRLCPGQKPSSRQECKITYPCSIYCRPISVRYHRSVVLCHTTNLHRLQEMLLSI